MPNDKVSNFWIDHEKRWIEYSPDDTTYDSAIRYFNYRINVARDMEPIINRRKIREMAYCLYKFTNKLAQADAGDIAYFKRRTFGVVEDTSTTRGL